MKSETAIIMLNDLLSDPVTVEQIERFVERRKGEGYQIANSPLTTQQLLNVFESSLSSPRAVHRVRETDFHSASDVDAQMPPCFEMGYIMVRERMPVSAAIANCGHKGMRPLTFREILMLDFATNVSTGFLMPAFGSTVSHGDSVGYPAFWDESRFHTMGLVESAEIYHRGNGRDFTRHLVVLPENMGLPRGTLIPVVDLS